MENPYTILRKKVFTIQAFILRNISFLFISPNILRYARWSLNIAWGSVRLNFGLGIGNRNQGPIFVLKPKVFLGGWSKMTQKIGHHLCMIPYGIGRESLSIWISDLNQNAVLVVHYYVSKRNGHFCWCYLCWHSGCVR